MFLLHLPGGQARAGQGESRLPLDFEVAALSLRGGQTRFGVLDSLLTELNKLVTEQIELILLHPEIDPALDRPDLLDEDCRETEGRLPDFFECFRFLRAWAQPSMSFSFFTPSRSSRPTSFFLRYFLKLRSEASEAPRGPRASARRSSMASASSRLCCFHVAFATLYSLGVQPKHFLKRRALPTSSRTSLSFRIL